MATVKVVSQNSGKSVSEKRVALGFDGNWLPGGVTSHEYTDSNGEAHFDVSPGKRKVYVDGKNVHQGHLSD